MSILNTVLLQSANLEIKYVGICLAIGVVIGLLWAYINRGEDKWTIELKEARKKAYKEREILNATMKANK